MDITDVLRFSESNTPIENGFMITAQAPTDARYIASNWDGDEYRATVRGIFLYKGMQVYSEASGILYICQSLPVLPPVRFTAADCTWEPLNSKEEINWELLNPES